MSWSLRIKAYAKINLGLRVLGRRSDGYHEIRTLMQSIDLGDTLILEKADESGIVLESAPSLSIPEEGNLVFQAASSVLTHNDVSGGVRIVLEKEIPLSSGLGGGSSDAAAALIGLNKLFQLKMAKEELMELGMKLGSDVPFFIEGGLCLVSGRGEVVRRLPPLPHSYYHLLILMPPFSLSAEEVYRRFDHLERGQSKANTDERYSLSHLRNDLEEAAAQLRPGIEEYKNFLKGFKADLLGMSGSGPALFAGFKDRDQAEKLAGEAAHLEAKIFPCKLIDRSYELLA